MFGHSLPTLADTATDVFLGWSLTEAYDPSVGVITLAQGVNSTLYAVYGKQVAFDLNYQKNGVQAGLFNSINVYTGETVEEQVAIYGNPFRVGYTFGGWYTDEACTTEFDSSKAITENQTVYAKWISSSPEKPNESTGESNSTNGVDIGVIIGISCAVVALAGVGVAVFIVLKKKKNKK